MTPSLALLLTIQIAAQAQPVLTPDSLLHPPDGPQYVLLDAPDATLSAVRVSVLFEEGPGERGAGALVRELAVQRAEALARGSGVEFAAARTPWGLSYTVMGPSADFERLGEVLRSALAAPETDDVRVGRARREVTQAIEGEYETPLGSLSRLLRTRVGGAEATPSGTPTTLMALGGGSLQAFWARTHARGSLRVVVASPASPELVVATLRELGRPGPPAESLGLSAPQELPPPETHVLRQWLGRAYLIPEPDDPRGAILAALLGEGLDEATSGFGHEHWIELRQTRAHQVLLVTGAAYAAQADEMRRHVRGMLETVANSISEGDVVRLRTRFLRAALESAATPAGRVEFVGRHYDASGSFTRGADYLAALEAVDVASLEALARELLAAPAAELEIR